LGSDTANVCHQDLGYVHDNLSQWERIEAGNEGSNESQRIAGMNPPALRQPPHPLCRTLMCEEKSAYFRTAKMIFRIHQLKQFLNVGKDEVEKKND
jgi:hypothetical protein